MTKGRISQQPHRQSSGDAPANSNLERGADGTITVHPLRGAGRQALFLAVPAGILAVISVVRELNRSAQAGIVTLVILLALAALVALYLSHYLHSNRIYLTGTVLGHIRDLRGTPQEVPREAVARLVQVSTCYWYGSNQPLLYLLVVGHDGRCLMRINWQYYEPADLRALGDALGVDYETIPDITPKSSAGRSRVRPPTWCATPSSSPRSSSS